MQGTSGQVSAGSIDVFFEAFRGLHATPHLAGDAKETVEIIKEILSGTDPRSVVAAGLPAPARMLVEAALKGVNHRFVEELKPDEALEVISKAQVGITWVQYAAAAHGAMAEIAYDDVVKLASCLPTIHIAMLSSKTLLPDLSSVISEVGRIIRDSEKKPVVSLISGPSKTADIEMRLVYGVHGPLAVHVVVLDWI